MAHKSSKRKGKKTFSTQITKFAPKLPPFPTNLSPFIHAWKRRISTSNNKRGNPKTPLFRKLPEKMIKGKNHLPCLLLRNRTKPNARPPHNATAHLSHGSPPQTREPRRNQAPAALPTSPDPRRDARDQRCRGEWEKKRERKRERVTGSARRADRRHGPLGWRRKASPLSLQLRRGEDWRREGGGMEEEGREATPGKERQVITHKKIAAQQ